jgi:hypothetical protein
MRLVFHFYTHNQSRTVRPQVEATARLMSNMSSFAKAIEIGNDCWLGTSKLIKVSLFYLASMFYSPNMLLSSAEEI